MAKFDTMESRTHRTATRLFGDAALWGELSAMVLFRAVTKKDRDFLEDARVAYSPTVEAIEYYADDFVGLKTIVDSGGDAVLHVKGQDYYVRHIAQVFDGDTFVAYCEKA